MKQTRQYFYVPFSEKVWTVSKEEQAEEDISPNKWDYGDNDHKTRYENIREATEGDIILCSYKQEIIAIGEVYDFSEAHDSYTYFKVTTKPEKIKPFSREYIENKTAIKIRSYGRHVKLKAEQIKVAQWIQQCYEQDREIPFEVNWEDEMTTSNTKQPLNQILYGPPGTGKTYHTIDKALEILLEYKKIESIPESREKKKKIFDEFKEKGQIEFVTFHQSYSYEEFVEGIKPVLSDNNEDDNERNDKVAYKISSGIFKKICEKARNNFDISKQKIENTQQNISIDYNKTLWRLYTIPDETPKSDFFEECIEKEQVWVSKQDSKGKIENDEIRGDYLVIPTANKGRSKTIRAFGVFGDLIEEREKRVYRKVKWLWKDTSQEGVFILEANFARNTFQRVIKAKSKVLQTIEKILQPERELKPYILIIDEINRGNISKIFGELITLIEPSKRIGNDEEVKVTLPYSNEEFGVPKNLYIIGTMNTADRSIALLDTALRRRFEFIEMMPKPDILIKPCEKVDLKQLLEKMNDRIEFLLDREHTIGHSFFIGIESVDELKEVFAKKIIPLLQEYFYDDYAKIDAVLNDNGMVEVQKSKVSSLFPNKDKDLDLEDKNIYEITDFKNWNEKNFQKIYDNNIQLNDKKDNE